jgi:hypothetical protein
VPEPPGPSPDKADSAIAPTVEPDTRPAKPAAGKQPAGKQPAGKPPAGKPPAGKAARQAAPTGTTAGKGGAP